MSSTMARRTAGKLGWGGGPLILFFPPHFFEATMLKEGERDHCHERMAVKALPGSSLEVVEAEFLFQLLMGLLANPSRLDGGGQGSQAGRSRQVGEIVFLLSRRPVFADKPGLVSRQMLLTLVPDPLRWSVGGAYTDSGKAGFELPLRPGSPAHSSPLGIGQHVFGRLR